MNSGTGALLGTVISALFVFGGTFLVQRNAKRQVTGTATDNLINNLQEERAADREQFYKEKADLHARLNEAFIRIERGEQRDRILSDYVSALRHHVDAGKGPPPPPFPPGLAGN